MASQEGVGGREWFCFGFKGNLLSVSGGLVANCRKNERLLQGQCSRSGVRKQGELGKCSYLYEDVVLNICFVHQKVQH